MKFEYRANDNKGRVQSGSIEASSQEAALQALDRHGLYVTLLREVGEKPFYAKKLRLFDHVSSKDVMLFSRQLAIMFRSHVSLIDALGTIGTQAKSKAFREKLLDIAEDVEAGTTFSDALGKHPKVFSEFYINIVKRGEALGNLSDVLQYLAEHLEREHELKSKVRSAFIYPIFVIVVAFAVITLLAVLVLPNLTSILEQSEQELPLITKIVIAFSGVYAQWWWAVLLGIGGVVAGVFRFSQTKRGKEMLHQWALKIPGIGGFMRMIYITRFGENLSTLIAGGVPIVQALTISARTVGNKVYEGIINEAKDSISQGDKIADVFEQYPKYFPPIFTQMIQVGEKSGALDDTLKQVVKFYQAEMNRSIDSYLALIEPILIVVLGLLVGGVMASLMIPLYQSVTTAI